MANQPAPCALCLSVDELGAMLDVTVEETPTRDAFRRALCVDCVTAIVEAMARSDRWGEGEPKDADSATISPPENHVGAGNECGELGNGGEPAGAASGGIEAPSDDDTGARTDGFSAQVEDNAAAGAELSQGKKNTKRSSHKK